MPTAESSLRLDRWLFFCRFFKTRVLATAAVKGGHVKLNGERPSAGSKVKRGDKIELLKDRLPYSMQVEEIPLRRGPASEASACYVEDAATIEQREAISRSLKQDRLLMPKTTGRPDKHTRRKLRNRKNSD